MSVIGKGDEEGLRHVEKDVVIPKKMKAKAMKLCEKHVKGTNTLTYLVANQQKINIVQENQLGYLILAHALVNEYMQCMTHAPSLTKIVYVYN